MGSSVLKGITTALLVTVLTLFAGIAWGATGFGGLSVSKLVDIGLLVSCLIGGYRAGKESGQFLLGGITGAGYVIVGTILLALFLPIQGWGFLQILAEGSVIGLIAGAMGAGGPKRDVRGYNYGRSQSRFTPTWYSQSYGDYDTDYVNKDSTQWGAVEHVSEGEKQPEIDWNDRADYEPLAIWEPEKVVVNDTEWNRPNIENTRSVVNTAKMETTSIRPMGNLRPWWEE